MNALRDIPTAKEIEVRLQSNEVLVHLPKDTPLGAVSKGIYVAGYKPDTNVWITAKGQWTAAGFRPQGWDDSLPSVANSDREPGVWELHYEKKDGKWKFVEAKQIERVVQIQDEDG